MAKEKKPIHLFVFDLDGTVIDSRQDIANVVNYGLELVDKPPLPMEAIMLKVGRGFVHLIENTLEIDDTTFKAVFPRMLDYYYEHCADHTTLYPTVLETLDVLKGQNKALAVLTNKPHRHTMKTLDRLDLHRYMSVVIGGDTLSEKKPNPLGLESILEQTGIAAERTVMIGDTDVDIETGKNAGVSTCACTYGLRPRNELEAASPNYLIDRFEQLLLLFC